jgi:hypothetical protein
MDVARETERQTNHADRFPPTPKTTPPPDIHAPYNL